MTRPDVARIREALIAARDITAARDTRLGNARPQALRTPTDRRRLDGALTAGLAKAGIDVGQWEAELADRPGASRRRALLRTGRASFPASGSSKP